MQPLAGQLANLFGRRYIALMVVSLYTLGSGLAGGASGPAMLIAGRAVQGAGSGGMMAIIGIIISDLVPLRLRSNYHAILAVTYAVGMAIGPVIGGAVVETTTWRWVRASYELSCVINLLTDIGVLHQPPRRCCVSYSSVVVSTCQVG